MNYGESTDADTGNATRKKTKPHPPTNESLLYAQNGPHEWKVQVSSHGAPRLQRHDVSAWWGREM